MLFIWCKLKRAESGEDVPRRVRQHAGADIAAPLRQHADREPVHHDLDNRAHNLITVGDAKHDGLSENREAGTAAERRQLPLQIATTERKRGTGGPSRSNTERKSPTL